MPRSGRISRARRTRSFHFIGIAMLHARAHKRGEQRMRRQRLGLKFRMELAAQKPRMLRRLDNFHVFSVGRPAGDAESRGQQSFFVLAIEFVAVPVALADFRFAVSLRGKRIRLRSHGHAPRRIVPPISSTPSSSRSL